MKSWVDLHALWQIVVVGLIAGAGLPALFALGLRAMSLPGASHGGAVAMPGETDRLIGGSKAGIVAAAFCFAVVLAAVGWGIYFIVKAS